MNLDSVQMIKLYGTLFYVSLAVAVIGLGLAVFFFFYFDIPTVYALMTGKAKEETIRKMQEENFKTGSLKNQYIHTGPTGKTGKTNKTRSTGNTGALTQNVAQPPVQQAPSPGQTAPLGGYQSNDTTVLQSREQETTVLANGQETTVLGGNGQETTVLGGYGQETTVLGGQGAETTVLGGYGEDTMVLNQTMSNNGATAVLSGGYQAVQTAQNFQFIVTESTLVIHTNEII